MQTQTVSSAEIFKIAGKKPEDENKVYVFSGANEDKDATRITSNSRINDLINSIA